MFIYSCNCSDIGCPLIEVGSFGKTQQSKCLHSPHLRTERDTASEKSCSLEYRTTSKVQKLRNPGLYNIIRTLKMTYFPMNELTDKYLVSNLN